MTGRSWRDRGPEIGGHEELGWREQEELGWREHEELGCAHMMSNILLNLRNTVALNDLFLGFTTGSKICR